MIKPKALKIGDTVAVLAPSGGAAHTFPHIYENGLEALRELGLKIKEYPTAKKPGDYLATNPKARAEDINNAFRDPEVNAIIATIGGEDSIRILPYLDYQAIKEHPKIILGYSDATAYLTAIHNTGLVTFNGPTILAGFSQIHALEEAYKKHLQTMLFNPPKNYTYPVYKQYAEGYPDWTYKENTGKVLELKNNPGPRHLQGTTTQGKLWGGCRALLNMLNGTKHWPEAEFFKEKILFLETAEDVPPPAEVRWLLRSLAAQGIIKNLNAILIGRARGYSDDMKEELDNTLQQIATEEQREDLTIITGLDFGHTDPQIILPLGIQAQINTKGTIKLLESPYQ